MTNSLNFAKRLFKAQGLGIHDRIPPTNFRAGPCQEYTTAFRDEVYMAIEEEFYANELSKERNRSDNFLMIVNSDENSSMMHPRDEHAGYYHIYHGKQFGDDVRG